MKEFFMKKKYLLILAFLLFAISIIPTKVFAENEKPWHAHFYKPEIYNVSINPENGRLLGFTIKLKTNDWWGSVEGKIGIQKKRFSTVDGPGKEMFPGGSYDQAHGYTSWDQLIPPKGPDNCEFVTWATTNYGEVFDWTAGGTKDAEYEVHVNFPNDETNGINLLTEEETTYYAVLWTNNNITIYPDDMLASFTAGNGQLILKTEPTEEGTNLLFGVTFNSNGGSKVSAQSIFSEKKATKPADPTKSGYTFVRWEKDGVPFDFNTPITENIELTAVWQINNYTVNYDSAGGAMPEGTPIQSYTVETPTTNLPAPTKTGYDYAGWYDSVSGNTITKIEKGSTGNKVLTAKWTPTEYTVTYNTNEGTPVTKGTYTIETGLNTLPETTREGYDFGGWYDNEACIGTAITTIPTGTTGDKTLYAKWTPTEYTITYNTNEGTPVTNGTYTIETETVTLPTPEKAGYDFGGWCDNEACTGTAITTIPTGTTGNKTLYAKWTPTEYTVTYNTNEGTPVTNGTYTIETGLNTLPEATREGYDFEGWYDNEECIGTAITNIPAGTTGNKTLYAKWDVVDYTIKYNLDDETTPINDTYTIESGKTLPEPTRPGYDFGGWFNNEGFTGEPVTKIEQGEIGNKELYAKWTPTEYTVVYNANGGTEPTDNTYTIETGLNALPETSKEGYDFEGWYDNEEFMGKPVTKIEQGEIGNKKLYAKWNAIEYTIEYNSNGGTKPEKEVYTIETGKELPKPTKPGYDFEGWYDNGELEGEPVTKIEQGEIGNRKLYAKWKEGKTTYKVNKFKENLDGTYTEDGEEIIEATTGDKVAYDKDNITGFKIDKEKSILEGTVDSLGNLALKVYYKRENYKITVDDGSENEKETTKKYGDNLNDLEKPTREGYIFAGWENEDGKIINPKDAINQDMKLKARWIKNENTRNNPKTGDSIMLTETVLIATLLINFIIIPKKKKINKK